MSLNSGSNISNNGLVFHLDIGNQKSYLGPPIQNLATVITPSSLGIVSNTYNVTTGTEEVYIPSLGKINSKYIDVYNDYPSSNNCCPNLFNYGTISATSNTLYTYAIVYNTYNGYTHPNFMYHYEYNGAAYVTEYGLYGNSSYGWQERDLGNNWKWSSAKFTTQANINYVYNYLFSYQYKKWNRIYVAKVLFTQGDYTNLHPKYWPNLNTTRSSTDNFLDLKKNYTITPSNISYANSGNVIYNGANTYTQFSTPITASQPYTLLLWAKPNTQLLTGATPPTGLNRKTPIVGPGPNWNPGIWVTNDNLRVHCNTEYRDLYISWTDTSWRMIGQTFDGSTCRAVYNGKVYVGDRIIGGYSPPTQSVTYLGAESSVGSSTNWDGEISSVMFYNRVLSSDEISQIFNSLRGRYGI